ncbi:MAG: hypothetical protein U0Q18_35770 [Bryobacteraceae bacterium]
MKASAKRAAKWLGIGLALLLILGLAAPYLSGDSFAPRVQAALERGLGRKVELGKVHFSLFSGPGLSVDDVVIHENPAVGIEPVAYVGTLDAVPRLMSLFGGHLEFASIRLEDATINVAKTGGPAEPGSWNFEPLLNPSVMRSLPEFHVRSGRINFKFGDTKSVFYLTGTDLDITPPSGGSSDWRVQFSGQPARTDKPARGFGNLLARGLWNQTGGGRLELDVRLEKSAMSEMTALLHGSDAGIHGLVSARMRLAGSLDNIRITGSLGLEDVHRWDLMPPYGRGWPFRLAGRLNVPAQTLEVEASSAGREALPLSVRFRCANYLSQPHWGVSANWNRFPIAPLMEAARHLGATLPPELQMTGTVDGALGYSGQGGWQGELDFHDASLAIPKSPPLRSTGAQIVFDRGHMRLAPANILTAKDEEAEVEADYDWGAQSLELTISTDAMRVESLRAQAALAAVPWLQDVPSGTWKGQLHYRLCGSDSCSGPTDKNGWTGYIELSDAEFSMPGLAEPVVVQAAAARFDGPRVLLERMHARAGKIAFDGEYRYEPQAARPHRLRLSMPQADAAELERVLLPTLRRDRGLLARALSLGRVSVPEWLANRHVDAAIQIGTLRLADAEIRQVQAHLLWDITKADFENVRARMAGGKVTGKLAVNLRGSRPVYRLEARATGFDWKSGKVDSDLTVESNGTGTELLSRLHSSGTFAAKGLEMTGIPALDSVSGTFDLVWTQMAPQLRLSGLQVVSEDETYTGQGDTQPDGKLLILLSSGSKELHMSGTLAELRLDVPEAR